MAKATKAAASRIRRPRAFGLPISAWLVIGFALVIGAFAWWLMRTRIGRVVDHQLDFLAPLPRIALDRARHVDRHGIGAGL